MMPYREFRLALIGQTVLWVFSMGLQMFIIWFGPGDVIPNPVLMTALILPADVFFWFASAYCLTAL